MRTSITSSLMRSINRAAVLELIREKSPIARSQIAQELDMSLSTVMRIVEDLINEDLVRACDSFGQSTGGRPPALVEFNGNAYAVVGVDMGWTQMLSAVANLSGQVQHEVSVTYEGSDSPDDHLAQLCETIETLLNAPRPEGQRIRGIGVGAPGVTLTPDGIVTWAPSLGWRDLPLQQILQDRFQRPVFVENDVNLAALGELGFGAGRGVENLVTIAVGPGIGSGIIVGGALYRGAHQAAGEICNMVPGVSFLGQSYREYGALESVASTKGIVRRARELLAAEGTTPPLPDPLRAEDIFAAAREGLEWAQQVVNETIDYLSLAIVNLCATLDPEVVVLSGGAARSADLFLAPIQARVQDMTPYLPRIVASPLEHRSVLMGGIMLVLNATANYITVKRLP